MARWEAYCLLVAFPTWEKIIFSSSGTPVAMGDALGMLFGAVRLKSKDSGINLTFMEAALLVAPHGRTMEAMHLWSEENV